MKEKKEFDCLLGQTWIFVLFVIIILSSACMAAFPLVTLHRYDSYKMIFYAGGIGLSVILMIVSFTVHNTKHNRFGMLSFLILFSSVVPGILLIMQLLFDIDRFIKAPFDQILLYLFGGLLCLSFLLSILGLFFCRQKADFLLSLGMFILFSTQIALPLLCKHISYSYKTNHPDCHSNLQRLSKSYIYASTVDEMMGVQNKWCDFLHQEWDIEFKQFLCRNDKIGPCSYAMNKNIPADANDLPGDLVLLFESAPGWNRVGGVDDVVTNRHDKPGANIAFADGHVEFIPAKDIPKLRWTVEHKRGTEVTR